MEIEMIGQLRMSKRCLRGPSATDTHCNDVLANPSGKPSAAICAHKLKTRPSQRARKLPTKPKMLHTHTHKSVSGRLGKWWRHWPRSWMKSCLINMTLPASSVRVFLRVGGFAKWPTHNRVFVYLPACQASICFGGHRFQRTRSATPST